MSDDPIETKALEREMTMMSKEPVLRWDYEGTAEERQALLARCAEDRDHLVGKVLAYYPRLKGRTPADLLVDIVSDVLDYPMISRPLTKGQFGLQSFQEPETWINDRLEDFADMEGSETQCVEATVRALMLGHLRLHTEEMRAMMAEPGFKDSLPPMSVASWSSRQKWEASVYATVFLVSPEDVIRISTGRAMSKARKSGEVWSSEMISTSLRILAEGLGTIPSAVRCALIDLGWLAVDQIDGEEQLRLVPLHPVAPESRL